MRAPAFLILLFSPLVLHTQRIVTVAGLPPNHRPAIDGKNALTAPLYSVYGLLLDRITGRLILHDVALMERLEPDGALLVLAGSGNSLQGDVADGIPASNLRTGTMRGMAQDASGAIYFSDPGLGMVFRLALDGTVSRFAGGGPIVFPGARGNFSNPRGLVFDSHGNLDVAEVNCRCIRSIDPTGAVSTVYTLPPSSTFTYFEGLAIDAGDNLYATEWAGHQVLKIAADGTVTTIAGTGVAGFSGDGGPAISAQLNSPTGVAVAPDGTLYISDSFNQRIRRITPDGIINTIAGNGQRAFSGDGGPAAAAAIFNPAQVLLDSGGNLFVADYGNARVRVITPDGIINTLAGNGNPTVFPPPPPTNGDGGPALNAVFNAIPAAVFDAAGNLLVAEMFGNRVRKIAPDGTVTTIAGTGNRDYSGDGGPAVKADITSPYGLTVDQQGSVYIAGADSRVRRIDPDGAIHLVAGTGTGTGLVRSQGDGGPAVNATLNEPKGVAVDAAGNVYIADTSNARLRMVDRNGIIRTVAGPGTLGSDYWNGVAIDPSGRLYVSITHTGASLWSIVERVNSDGSLTPVAGNADPQACGGGVLEFTADGQPATGVPLCLILSLSFDSHGNLYIPESRYGAVLRVTPDGAISRIAGSSHANLFSGDGGPPLEASLAASQYYSPAGVAVDAAGNLFIPQSGANRIREVTATPLTLKLDPQPGKPQTIAVTTNFGEPFPYLVRTNGAWLSTNRASGLTGEPFQVITDSTGLSSGTYRGAVTVILAVPIPIQADLPVTLTVP